MAIIYQPRGAAREYAEYAVNIYRGCSHGCRYCYAPSCLRMSRDQFRAATTPRPNLLDRLKHDLAAHGRPVAPILLSFTSDPYQPAESVHGLTRDVISLLESHECSIRLLTKAPSLAMHRDGQLLAEAMVDCGTSLSWTRESDRCHWEPNAATIVERLDYLRWARDAGLPTWVSVEPVIDPDQAIDVIRLCGSFVDMIHVGRWNHDRRANEIDYGAFLRRSLSALSQLPCDYRIKDALWRHRDLRLEREFPRSRFARRPVSVSSR